LQGALARREGRGQPVRFGPGRAEKAAEARNAHFAMRNETLRMAWGKSLESLWAPNQSFRGIVCFQRLELGFVSPFSHGCLFSIT
jgi:hypothetical protein